MILTSTVLSRNTRVTEDGQTDDIIMSDNKIATFGKKSKNYYVNK